MTDWYRLDVESTLRGLGSDAAFGLSSVVFWAVEAQKAWVRWRSEKIAR